MYIALYARQSIDKENSVSIETQLEYCRSMIRPDEKRCRVKEFSDRGYSGKDTNRPAFQQLMNDAKRGKVKKLIVYKLDRVSRSLIDFVDMLGIFKEHHVEFVSSQEMFDTSSPYGEMIMKLLMVFAEFERASIINRIRDAYDKRSSMGLYSGGRRVYGYNLENAVIHGIKTKKFVPNEEEAEHIRYIFETYALPGMTLRQLQTNLSENGVIPAGGSGWSSGKLGALLRNPIYAKADADIYVYYKNRSANIINSISEFDGRKHVRLYGRTKHDKTLPDWRDMKIVLIDGEGLVSSGIWLKCQDKLGKNKQIGRTLSCHSSWLSGRLICAKCRRTMTVVQSASGRYFICTGKSYTKTCTGINKTVYADFMEEMVYNCIAKRFENLILARSDSRSEPESEIEINSLKIRVNEIENQLENMIGAVLDGSLNNDIVSVLNSRAKKLGDEKRALSKKILSLSESNASKVPDIKFSEKWANADFSEKRAAANILIRTIVIYEDGTPEIIWNI